MDHPNGIWAIHGARQAAYLTLNKLHDYNLIHDFDYLNICFKNLYYDLPRQLISRANEYGQLLNDSRIKSVFNAEQSVEYRNNYQHPLRSPETFLKHPPVLEYDQFIVQDLDSVDELSLASKSTTDYFWVSTHYNNITDYKPEFYAPAKTYEFMGASLVPRIATLRT
jgi:hypothetical protein